MVHPMQLEEQAKKKLEEFLQNVQNTDFLWLDEILEEAIKMFRNNSDGEPEMMPKTPSQKNRRKKRFSSVKKDSFSKKRLSKRTATQSSKRISQQSQQKKDLEITKTDEDYNSPCRRVTRSQALKSARHSDAALKNSAIHLAKGRIPLVEISINERNSAEFQLNKTPPEKTALTFTLSSDKSPKRRSQALSKVSLLVVPDTPEAKIMKEGREACKLKIANASIARTTENKEANAQEENSCVQQHFTLETTQSISESPQTPTAPKANRHSVRRSLIGRNPKNCQASLVERCSLSAKRERMVQKSIGRTLSKRKTTQRSPSASRRMSSQTAMEKLVDEQISESGPELDPASHSQEASLTATATPREEQEGGDCKEGPSEKCKEMQMQPQSARRKASYKRAVSELDDGQPMEDELSPPRKKPPSPQCPASKVVRPLKTFLHTVHKNQLLMMTPGSVTRNSTIKSFLRQNTPKEKERQRLENLKKKEEVEQQRRLKLEEEKRRRLEEMKRKREERLRKVLQARERVEQLEEEKKKKLEQKHAQHVEKNEKVREEKMAEDKVKKKVAAKKLEELEARRKQEEARKQRALQLEEEEHKHKELLQKKKEEEQEKARKIAEQHQADLEREKQLSAERELEKKREQEKLQAQREHERQEKEKAASLQRELLAAAKEKERLKKEMEEKERILEQRKHVEQQLKELEATAVTAPVRLNVTMDVESSLACNSYQMTPQGPKQPKLDLNNYGMDLNSDDSTDDESQPRKPIPAWATGNQLSQAIIHQYYHPPDTKVLFGVVKSPKLEEIFYKSKPRYFKRTSSAVWNSPPFPGGKSVPSTFKRC
ncbi:inner centromere protein [Varanus komodoensis]|uniref:inner centromere protein n=1 Tax=Varanus komodoensis TaxID=61221 RepID=UPI001CF7C400|nr:inner centromere protein [Varanus komodoensis]